MEMRHDIRTEEQRTDAEHPQHNLRRVPGVKRRPLLRNALIGAAVLMPLPSWGC
ncbi:hypothetical protein QJS66_03485 [Kocuria rhizophila]|nr:hypothetical protein QJS66_03485 [Kocuria rhizophila]